ncbi:hypothetical protein PMI30_04678 [Pseudomonas sp. GM50]|nr:hypothetical protein PMI30_04678 [Pseudomonas sp. GM50]
MQFSQSAFCHEPFNCCWRATRCHRQPGKCDLKACNFSIKKYLTFSLKFFVPASVVIFNNKAMVKFMSKTKMQPAAFFAERELIYWRGREDDEQYPCQVSRQVDHYVSLNLDIMPFRFADAVAEDIAHCLYDAVLITVGNLAGFVPTPAYRDSILDRTYRKRVSGEWSFSAISRFSCYETEGDVYVVELATDESEKTGKVSVYTIEDGGVELVFDFMCYSFSMHDAVWLSNALMEAMGRDPLDALETVSAGCRP